jgi:hypothetical protein
MSFVPVLCLGFLLCGTIASLAQQEQLRRGNQTRVKLLCNAEAQSDSGRTYRLDWVFDVDYANGKVDNRPASISSDFIILLLESGDVRVKINRYTGRMEVQDVKPRSNSLHYFGNCRLAPPQAF